MGTFIRIIEFTPTYKIVTATQGFVCIKRQFNPI